MSNSSKVNRIKDQQPAVPPARLNLWLFMLASSMLFAAVVSAFIVHRPDAEGRGAWTAFDLPVFFLYSTIIVIASSVTAYLAQKNAKNDELAANRSFLLITTVLGILFCISQYLGWQQMIRLDLTFVNARPEDISASYVWVITALHFVHILGGIALLIATWISAVRLNVHKKSMGLMTITHTYWHFVGVLWIFLYLFLYFAQ
jgi:cytochrome c oxidase subunit 3